MSLSHSNEAIEAILFDLGNVIFTLDIPRATQNITKLLKPNTPPGAVFEVIKKFETGQISTSLFINDILQLCPYSVQARDVIIAWNSMLEGMPYERIERLRALKQQYQVLLLSNNNELHYEYLENYLMENYGVNDFNQSCFHHAFYSHQIKIRKPDHEAFHFIVDATGIRPGRTLFVDDMPENILAAKRCGFQTILFHPQSDFLEFTSKLINSK